MDPSFLLLLSPETLAVLAMHTTVNMIMREGNEGVSLTQIGGAVQIEVRVPTVPVILERRWGSLTGLLWVG